MKKLFLCLFMTGISACVSTDNRSVQSPQEHADYNACLAEAKETVPDYLYKRPYYEEQNIIDSHGIIRTQNVLVEPDYHNRMLDKERMAIIDPCMRKKGWDDPKSWPPSAPEAH